MEPLGESHTKLEFSIPARGLIGARTALLTLSQGEAILSHVFDVVEARTAAASRAAPAACWSPTARARPCPTPSSAWRTAGTFFVPPVTGLRGHGRRREQQGQRPAGQRLPHEEAHEHARLGPGRQRQDPGPAAVMSLEESTRVHRGRRAARGHADQPAPAQAGAQQRPAPQGPRYRTRVSSPGRGRKAISSTTSPAKYSTSLRALEGTETTPERPSTSGTSV